MDLGSSVHFNLSWHAADGKSWRWWECMCCVEWWAVATRLPDTTVNIVPEWCLPTQHVINRRDRLHFWTMFHILRRLLSARMELLHFIKSSLTHYHSRPHLFLPCSHLLTWASNPIATSWPETQQRIRLSESSWGSCNCSVSLLFLKILLADANVFQPHAQIYSFESCVSIAT